jgi:hypothetical protein
MALPNETPTAAPAGVLYQERFPDGTEASEELVGRFIDRHGLLQAILVQLTGGVFLTGFALALGASSTVIGMLAGVPFMVKLSQLYLSWRIERVGHWRRSALEGALLSRAALLIAALAPLVVGPGAGAWVLVAVIAAAALGATIVEMAFQTWMAELIPEGSRGEFGGDVRASRASPACSLLLFIAATPLPGGVREPGGVTVGRMIRVMGRFRSMNTEYVGDFLFEHVYTHIARVADFIAREERNPREPT